MYSETDALFVRAGAPLDSPKLGASESGFPSVLLALVLILRIKNLIPNF